MDYGIATKVLSENGQGHVLQFWDRLCPDERAALLQQIERLDFPSIARMKQLMSSQTVVSEQSAFSPVEVLRPSADERARAGGVGEEALRKGGVGVILVAGGQGSRLGFDGPKGCFPIAPLSNGTLFEIHCRKVLALERRHGCAIPLYIMTSAENNDATVGFFRKNSNFGLSGERVKFFKQGMWPALDSSGRIVLDRPNHIFMSPDGHGGTLSALLDNGMLDDMKRRNIGSLFYFQVDNPMVEIADPVFIGLHLERKAEMSVKVCGKRDPEEGLGVVVMREGRASMVEYTELTREQKHARSAGGELKYNAGSVAIHVFSTAFLKKEASAQMPIHVAHKKVPYCDSTGLTIKPEKPNAYKFEKFIFDALPHAERTVILDFMRSDEFSPVKNAVGDDSPETVRRDMIGKWARWLGECGFLVPMDKAGIPSCKIEIDPCFALDAAELRKKLPRGFAITGDVLLRQE